jgi:transposase
MGLLLSMVAVAQRASVRRAEDDSGMPQNFLTCDREQDFLMPPSLRDWLPEDHLAWFVLAAVEEMDLSAFYAVYRPDGHGRAAHDPAMMVALLLHAYAKGQLLARDRARMHRGHRLPRDRANQRPDHCTIARFRQRHEDALAGSFGAVLSSCAQARLVGVGVIAIDGTKVHANASQHATRDYEQIAREILEQAAEVDALEAASSASGVAMSSRQSCRPVKADSAGCVTPGGGSTTGAEAARPVPRSRAQRLVEAERRL